ncbi:MAG: class I SAM-dependent methyltransferase, partial [Acidobacteria bacterium]|nr:class I SAM-dependent methyltransferase [Acidobacteriota bacterium]
MDYITWHNLLMQLSELKKNVRAFMDKNAAKRDTWIKRNPYYYKQLVKFLRFNIPPGSKVLEIGCGTGYLLDKVQPGVGVGIDFSVSMIEIARQNYPHLSFIHMDAENITIDEKFDYIIISDAIGYFEDIQQQFSQLQKVSTADTRIIITYLNFLWLPVLKLAEFFKLKMPSQNINWLDIDDIKNLLALAGFQTIKTGRKCLIPVFIPFFSWFFNKIFAHLPLI